MLVAPLSAGAYLTRCARVWSGSVCHFPLLCSGGGGFGGDGCESAGRRSRGRVVSVLEGGYSLCETAPAQPAKKPAQKKGGSTAATGYASFCRNHNLPLTFVISQLQGRAKEPMPSNHLRALARLLVRVVCEISPALSLTPCYLTSSSCHRHTHHSA